MNGTHNVHRHTHSRPCTYTYLAEHTHARTMASVQHDNGTTHNESASPEGKNSSLMSLLLQCLCSMACGSSTETNQPSKSQPHKTQETHNASTGIQPLATTEMSNSSVNVNPTSSELDDISAACSKLWELDVNRLDPGSEYRINVQGGKKAYDMTYDAAPEPLFSFVDKEEYFRKPTFRLFYSLLDNYERETGKTERVGQEERAEVNRFIDATCATPCMQYVRNYLISHNKIVLGSDLNDFKQLIWQTWFSAYRRDTQNDTSGFEHVFVGEIRNGKVIGLHNWIQFFVEEKAGKIDYKGYIYPRRRGNNPDEQDRILKVQFAWEGITKQLTTLLIGTSPEFELALYTLCFFVGQDDTSVTIGDYDVIVKTNRIRSKYGDKIGTAYVSI